VRTLAWLGACLAVVASAAWASTAGAVPNLLQYQGRLTNAAGAPITGSHSVLFALYSGASGGPPLWTEVQVVALDDGMFSVLLGGLTPLPSDAFAADGRWLGIKLDADPEMSPRQRVTSVAYALRAGQADRVVEAADHDFSLTLIVKPNDVRWINVRADGTVLGQSGGFTVFKRGAGQYRVEHSTVEENKVGLVGGSLGMPASGPALVTVAPDTLLGGVAVVTFVSLGAVTIPTSAGEVRTSSATPTSALPAPPEPRR